MPKKVVELSREEWDRIGRRVGARLEERSESEARRLQREMERRKQGIAPVGLEFAGGLLTGALANIAGTPADTVDTILNPQRLVGGERKVVVPIVKDLTSEALMERALGALGDRINHPEALAAGLIGGGLLAMAAGGGGKKAPKAPKIKLPKGANAAKVTPTPEQLAETNRLLRKFASASRETWTGAPKALKAVDEMTSRESRFADVWKQLDPAEPVPRPLTWEIRDKFAQGLPEIDPAELKRVYDRAMRLPIDPQSKSASDMPWLRGMSVREAQKAALTALPKAGSEVRTPSGTVTVPDVKGLKKQIATLAVAAKAGEQLMPDASNWYQDSQKFIAGMSGNDPRYARKLARVIAATSGQKPVQANLQSAARQLHAELLGDKWRYVNNEMTPYMPGVMAAERGVTPSSEKFGAFAQEIDPNTGGLLRDPDAPYIGAVTDTRSGQLDAAIQKGTVKPSMKEGLIAAVEPPFPPKEENASIPAGLHKFVDAKTALAAKAAGMDPYGVQAASWGMQEYLRNKVGAKKPIPEAELRERSMAYLTGYLPENLHFTNEFVPGAGTGSKIALLPEADRVAFSRAMEEALAGPHRRDAFLEVLGKIPGDVSGHGVGLWTSPVTGMQEINPNVTTTMLTSWTKGSGKTPPQLDPLTERVANAYSALRGLLTEQEAIASSMPVFDPAKPSSWWIRAAEKPTPAQMKLLEQELAARGLPTGIPDFGDTSFMVTDFSGKGPRGAVIRKAIPQVEEAARAAGIIPKEIRATERLGTYYDLPWGQSTLGSGVVTRKVLDDLKKEKALWNKLNAKRDMKNALADLAGRLAEARRPWAEREFAPGVRLLRPDQQRLLEDLASAEARKIGPLRYIEQQLESGRGYYPAIGLPFLLGGLLSTDERQ